MFLKLNQMRKNCSFVEEISNCFSDSFQCHFLCKILSDRITKHGSQSKFTTLRDFFHNCFLETLYCLSIMWNLKLILTLLKPFENNLRNFFISFIGQHSRDNNMHDSDHRLQDEAAATHRKVTIAGITIKGDLLLSELFICSSNIKGLQIKLHKPFI